MDRCFTIMIIPEREKGVRSFRIPKMMFHTFAVFSVIFIFLLAILAYDYWKILKQVYENKHLTIENRQLKEQIQLFQMKINTLSEDIERIHTFEKKLRIITGIERADMTRDLKRNFDDNHFEDGPEDRDKSGIERQNNKRKNDSALFKPIDLNRDFRDEKKYLKLKKLYEKKIATTFGLQTSYAFTKEWSELTKQSFALATQFAQFDYRFNLVRNFTKGLEVEIHELDQFLLDKDSFIKSTPTLIPTRGWITSYYGLRKSPYSGRPKMHEGLDIGAKIGSPIVAPADGIVVDSGRKPGFGIHIKLDHGYGLETVYAHAQVGSAKVKKGQLVKRGDIIAQVGNTGYSTGPHVHYEIRINGTSVDPLYYILD